jgi:uncharacterized protein with ATP-grasp and redox domains
MMEQALRVGRISTQDERKIKELLDKIGDMIKNIPMENTPAQTGETLYRLAGEITGNVDPFKYIKIANIQEALSLYPYLQEIVKNSDDKLLTAIRIAIAGNVIDHGINKDFNIKEDVQSILQQEFALFDYNKFIQELNRAQSILYIGDNAGESVFDKILIEELDKPVTYVVRENPIINDATYEDAIASGLDDVAEIVSSGISAPGIVLELCNKDFIKRFENADLIISKGQGNFEGLSNANRSIFFLLKAKCQIIADHLGVQEGDIIFTGHNV